jgi:response regulator RpfG family c-di-GMP phosphodiesterase
MVRQKSASLSRALDELRHAYEFTLEALVAMLDAREHETAMHSSRVREMTLIVGREMGLRQGELDDISRGALLHDIGKIAIPDAILLKKGPLTEEEWAVMKTHPEVGYRIVSSSAHLRNAAEIVLAHHEHYDGSGYPRGLKGSQICLGARIFAVVDAYDTMRSRRCYKEPYSADHAVRQLKQHSGTQFDPGIVEACLLCQDRLETYSQWTA